MSFAPWAPPVDERLRDLVERCVGSEVGPGRNHPGDADRYLGVVAPLARRVRTEPAALHHRVVVHRRRAELVRNAKCVAAGLAEQDDGGAVALCGGGCHSGSPSQLYVF